MQPNQPFIEQTMPSSQQPPAAAPWQGPASMAKSFVLYAIFTGIFFSVCFVGFDKPPSFALFVYSLVTMIMLSLLFFYNKLVENPKGFLYCIPILLFSFLNAVFQYNILSKFNIGMVFFYFAVMVYSLRGYSIVADIKQCFLGVSAITFPSFTPLGALIAEALPKKESRSHATPYIKKILLGLVLSLPVVLVLLALLVSADLMFRHFFLQLHRVFQIFTIGDFILRFWQMIVATVVAFYTMAYLCHSVKLSSYASNGKKMHLDNVVWVTFLSVINLLFAVFCIIQFLFLFHGGFMALPANFTYASYARRGFFELLFVTCINFAIVVSFISVIRQDAAQKAIRGLLLLLCLFTGILVYSSFYRMSMYIAANGYTILRVQVITFLVMECFLLLVTGIYLLWGKLPLFPCYLLIITLFIAAVNITGSEYNVTRLNINRYHKTGEINCAYFELISNESIGQLYAFYHQQPELRERLAPYLRYPDMSHTTWQSRTLLKEFGAAQAHAYRDVYPALFSIQ